MIVKSYEDEQAFPVQMSDIDRGAYGLTKLEYTAIAALQGILSNPSIKPHSDNACNLAHEAKMLALELMQQLEEMKDEEL